MPLSKSNGCKSNLVHDLRLNGAVSCILIAWLSFEFLWTLKISHAARCLILEGPFFFTNENRSRGNRSEAKRRDKVKYGFIQGVKKVVATALRGESTPL